MAYAIIFPGQGAQEVGMGKELFDEFKEAREVLELADEALSFRLSRLIFDGPEAELQKTEFTQPAIMAVSMASFKVLSSLAPGELSPLFVAGHSLGEYTALVAAQALSLEEGLRLVRLRGQLMQEAVPVGEGAMAAIIGLEESVIVEICKAASKGGKVCEVANYNSGQQLVISGHATAVAEAMEAAKKAGAKRAVPLKVSAPFHCSLMRPVADTLSRAFEACSWRRPVWPLVANATATPVTDIGEIQNVLRRQTYSPVLWKNSIQFMANSGASAFIEAAPGNVLSGLLKGCVSGVESYNLKDLKNLEKTLDFIKGGL
ncbi:ACP S-malonyltransferase [Acetomicrobium sp. S15 = DSM 107314]|uniref:ACP S-malonyltransferase n=1 Tax=Acetomicrobium sp. S15 = DSM 107314 TaxID=2529858 RepID=UPI0018E11356|nr:ACP S-malonyltransferase [Acetomicrobium sp. S15 = DSM 107314]